MARPLRLEIPGGLYHVTSRGDGREDIYLDDADRQNWLELFAGVCERFNWSCHAYCLMTNHYHVIIETPDGNLSIGMRQLNGVYTQSFNRRHSRVGHVFQGRYKAIFVDKDSYLLELSRYVILNPVRATMVQRPEYWPWTSYHFMIDARSPPKWLHRDWLLSQFGKQRRRAIEKFIEFVADGISSGSIWENLNGQIFLGDAQFVSEIQKKIDHPEELGEVPRGQRRVPGKPMQYYERRYADRKSAMAHAHLDGQYTLKQVAAYFGVHYTTVSRAVRQFLSL